MTKYKLIGKPVVWRAKDGKVYHLGNEKLQKRGLPDKVFEEVLKSGRIEEIKEVKDGN